MHGRILTQFSCGQSLSSPALLHGGHCSVHFTGGFRRREVIPRDKCPEAAGAAPSSKGTITARPKQVVLGRRMEGANMSLPFFCD